MTNLTYDDINNESLEDLVKKYPKTNIESIKSSIHMFEKNDKTINDAINAFNKKINKPDRDEIIYELSERYLPSYNVPMITPASKPTPTPVPTTAPVPKLFTNDYITDTIFIDEFSINKYSVGEFIEDFAIDTRSEITLDDAKKANVYITSDLHGDYLRLLQHLINSKIIDGNIQDSINNIKSDNVMTYISDFDYIIDEMKWIKQDCVLILNGDIIESCIKDNCLLYDKYHNELFIHIIIYNLRILAIKNNSIVKIVMGNHDFNVFSKDGNKEYSGFEDDVAHPFKNDDYDQYDQYVSNRKTILSKFYNQSPLHILLKDTGGKTLATIVHGGIFDYDSDENQSNGKLLTLKYLNESNNEWHHIIKENNYNADFHKYESTYFKHLWSRPPKMMESTTNLKNYNDAASKLKNTHDYGDYLIFGHSIVAKKNDGLAKIIKNGKIIYVDMGVSTTKNSSNKNTDFEILHIDFTNEDPNKLEGISTIGKTRIITGGIIGGDSKHCVYIIIIVILLLFLICIIYRIIVRVELPVVVSDIMLI